MLDFLIITLTALLLLVGLIGTVVPFIPGTVLVFLGTFVYAWYTGFTVLGWGMLGVLAGLTLLAQALDSLASVIGAKKFGASRWGIIGAFIGGILGLLFGGLPGILIGPFVGALLCELLQGKGMKASFKIGVGTLVGFLGGAVGKIIIAVTMIGIFLIQLL